MTLETFFEKFELFADAPGAVGRMRELVLELAARGKLHVGESGEWKEGVLGDVIELISGQHLLAHEHNAEGRGIPYLTGPSDFGEKSPIATRWTDQPKVTAEPGDILITVKGSGVGKTNVLVDQQTSISRQLMAIRVVGADPEFVHVMLKQAAKHFQNSKTGIAIPGIGRREVLGLKIVLPPLAEQKRIVAKVDELMALCDRLEAQQQERETRHAALARASLARFAAAPTPANLDFLFHKSYAIPPADLRKSILTLAVQGKLVPQDPDDEPAEEIVSRIEAIRPDGADAPVDERELPWSLPSCWQWVRLSAIANIKHGYAFSSESFTSKPTRYVLTTPGNFYESGGFRDRGANTKYFNGDVPPAFVFNPRDLIIPMTEQAAGLLGSPAFIPDDGKTYLHNQRLGRLEFYSDEVAPEFVFWFFNSEFFRGELARTCTGMKVRHTSPKRILKVPFALPPLPEQRRIVAKVDQLMALVDELEARLAASRATARNLLSALIAELTST
jgi:type I restriction enzyme, S subunit